ncbi:energy-coupling factor transporter transmembrane protein EcfT [candidate division KSB1 bacterium]|nr:MAG: energy-coupling factor transporter transmembrane protein EcfT [candidate division KSB1 bacterium]
MTMLNDITLGQYYPCDSFVHRLDPRTKIISLFFLMSGLLVTFEPYILLGFVVVIVLALAVSRLPLTAVIRNIRPFIWLFLLTILVHLFWTRGHVFARLPVLGLSLTWEGLNLGLIYSLRLILLIILAAMLTLSTSPIELTDALEKMFAPLKRLKAPTHEIVMMLTLALRFIPTLLEEAQRLKNAQASRGASFEGNIIKRIKSIVPLVIPLFIAAFRRADDLAAAMDSRCYTGGDGRSSFKRLKFRGADYIILSASTMMLVAIIFVKF